MMIMQQNELPSKKRWPSVRGKIPAELYPEWAKRIKQTKVAERYRKEAEVLYSQGDVGLRRKADERHRKALDILLHADAAFKRELRKHFDKRYTITALAVDKWVVHTWPPHYPKDTVSYTFYKSMK